MDCIVGSRVFVDIHRGEVTDSEGPVIVGALKYTPDAEERFVSVCPLLMHLWGALACLLDEVKVAARIHILLVGKHLLHPHEGSIDRKVRVWHCGRLFKLHLLTMAVRESRRSLANLMASQLSRLLLSPLRMRATY